MITEKMNIRMDSVFSDDKKHRFLLRRSWARDGKIATVIMINPNKAECLITDTTSVGKSKVAVFLLAISHGIVFIIW